EGGEPKRLTNTLNPEIDSEDLVDAEVIRFASYDGLEIPGILYRPHQASTDDPVPALVWVHGGPGGQSRVGYSPLIQHLVNHGYAFFGPYDRRHGEADLGDVVASRDMLA